MLPPIWDISRLTNPFIALAYPAISTISIFAKNPHFFKHPVHPQKTDLLPTHVLSTHIY